jgi:hypothetical protein
VDHASILDDPIERNFAYESFNGKDRLIPNTWAGLESCAQCNILQRRKAKTNRLSINTHSIFMIKTQTSLKNQTSCGKQSVNQV